MSEALWTPSLVERLRALWAEGLSTSKIAQRLNEVWLESLPIREGGGVDPEPFTKNAVVGKARRLRLTPRPSPIRVKRAAAAV